MNEDHKKIEQLFTRLQYLDKQQERFSREIDALKHEINKLKAKTAYPEPPASLEEAPVASSAPIPAVATAEPISKEEPMLKSSRTKGGLEKYIGENLISKLGIAIIVIGVGIGAKFAIDNDLISPVIRVILGYLVGGVLLGLAIRLKGPYHTYSAVLLSGAMAIFYFMTYLSHSFYDFLPSLLAFGLMVAITGMTVAAAVYYKEQVIALIGQVGAYAVPFLLSDGSDDMGTLFTYMAIINAGILVVAFRQYWKLLYASAFVITWLFFATWCLLEYDGTREFSLAFGFNVVFFLLFYLTFLAYKLVRAEQYQLADVFLLLSNSFVFFGIGYGLWSTHPSLEHLLGAFAMINGGIHLVVGMVIYFNEKADKNVLLLVTGLVMLFFTIAIPIQLDGNWVTLLWLIEGALLWVIGRVRAADLYEKMAYPILTLAFLSLVQDWGDAYWLSAVGLTEGYRPIGNIGFFTTCIAIAAYGTVQWLASQKENVSPFPSSSVWGIWGRYILPIFLILCVYSLWWQEITLYWNYTIKAAKRLNEPRALIRDYEGLSLVWRIIYTMCFLTALTWINNLRIKSKSLALVNIVLKALTVLFFLVAGLKVMADLRESYYAAAADKPAVYLWIRYLGLGSLALLLWITKLSLEIWEMKKPWKSVFDLALHFIALVVLSNEWLIWGTTLKLGESYKLGLSILWGCYALFLIVLGIWRKHAYLRVAAFVLFGVTLLKLFFYDIAHLPTLPKTIIFIALGSLLLLISFLYNKYRLTLFGEEADQNDQQTGP